ncbi:esterase/lipase family protein [Amycolatopsis nigrescens]|uniref:esterase/lipase family protein n=1 Tax=Amycolatopsis nigrescens TaxID=381445 RepID=UPI00036B4FD4|nr:alpha/beta fold hydrolase [Amycolatopsis nigrescens]
MRLRRPGIVTLALVLLAGSLGAPAAAANPRGVNDWSCRPSAAHPEPVVLVHGTGDNKERTWREIGPVLEREGYCAYSLTYGVLPDSPITGDVVGGLMPMDYSAKELRDFIEVVRAVTGAGKVDIVGYSQGTMVPTYYAKLLGGQDKINRYVSLAPIWGGTNLFGLAYIYGLLRTLGLGAVSGLLTNCAACPDLLTGSEMLRKLHEGGIFLPNISYTNIVTEYDRNIVPYTSGLGDGPNVRNVVLQESCPADQVDHVGIVFDPNAIGHVLGALDPAGARPVPCVPVQR